MRPPTPPPPQCKEVSINLGEESEVQSCFHVQQRLESKSVTTENDAPHCAIKGCVSGALKGSFPTTKHMLYKKGRYLLDSMV